MLLSDQMKSLDCTYYMIDKLVPKSTLVLVLSSIFSQKSITCHHTCSFGIKTDIYLSNAREVTRTIHKDKINEAPRGVNLVENGPTYI